MPSCSECPEMLPHTCERRVARSIRLPPLLPLPTLRTLHRRIWPTRNMDVRSSSWSVSSSSDSDSDSDSDSSPASFLPPFRLATGARTSEASARVTVPLRPFGSDTVSPRSLTSVTTPSTFMPTRRVLYLSSSTNLLSPPVFFAPGHHAGACEWGGWIHAGGGNVRSVGAMRKSDGAMRRRRRVPRRSAGAPGRRGMTTSFVGHIRGVPEMRVVASVGTHPAVVVVEHPVLGPLLGGGGGAAGGTSATAREVIAARARGAARERLLGVVLVSGSLSTHRTCHRDARAILECVGPDVSPDAMRSGGRRAMCSAPTAGTNSFEQPPPR